ncbi:7364_t:CDS:1, partial [Entrophospora sp. SA101]
KQFGFTAPSKYLPTDIDAEFNTDFDFWFEDDATPITHQLKWILHKWHCTNLYMAWDFYRHGDHINHQK